MIDPLPKRAEPRSELKPRPDKELPKRTSVKKRKRTARKQRSPSKSAERHRRLYSGHVLDWTNTFSRSTVYWDKNCELLDQEKPYVKARTYKQITDRCCGHSPGKSHTKVHDLTEEGERVWTYPEVKRPLQRQPKTPEKVLSAHTPSKSSPYRQQSKCINITTPNKQTPMLKREKVQSSDIKVLAAKLAQVLVNPSKTDTFMHGKVEVKGKPVSMAKFLEMQ